MIQKSGGGTGDDGESAVPESEPVSEADQAVQEAETLFEEFTKGIETGGETRKDD